MTTSELKTKLTKSVDFLKTELSQIRTGRASPALLDSVSVDAYGTKMGLKEVGSITLLDTQSLVVTPWDKSLIGAVAKAIRESGLGLNPVEDVDRVRVPVPALTEERRKEYAKVVSTKVEECKNSLRSVRQDAMKDIEKDFSEKTISEDEKFKLKEDVEKIVKEFVENADKLGEDKKQELLTI